MTEDTPMTEADLLAFLEKIDVESALHRHPPLFTVADSQDLCGDLPGAHCKNMFLRDKKGGFWLVTCLEDRKIRIKDLQEALDAPKMSFGKPEQMMATVGVSPGAVTPFAVINDRRDKRVTVVLDHALLAADLVNVHPLHNEATIALSPKALLKFFAETGHEPRLIDFDVLEAAAAAANPPV